VLAPNLVLSPCVIGKNGPALCPLVGSAPPALRPSAGHAPPVPAHSAAQYNRTRVRRGGIAADENATSAAGMRQCGWRGRARIHWPGTGLDPEICKQPRCGGPGRRDTTRCCVLGLDCGTAAGVHSVGRTARRKGPQTAVTDRGRTVETARDRIGIGSRPRASQLSPIRAHGQACGRGGEPSPRRRSSATAAPPRARPQWPRPAHAHGQASQPHNIEPG